MKRIIGLLAILTLLFATKAEATHYAAVDIYYVYKAPLNYDVHLILYRDCTPGNAGFSSIEGMCAVSASCTQNINFSVDTNGTNDPLNGDTLDQLCPGVQNKCQNASSLFVGFEYWHYVQNVTLPSACADWKFIWQSCCRNTTSNMQGQPGISVIAELNNLARPVNSSVRLAILPIPYVCNLQLTNYLNGPIDPDLDSIVFVGQAPQENGNCQTGLSTDCGYAGSFSAAAPLPLVGAYVVNPSTGVATFTPNGIGNYVLAFRADEYDRITGVKVGSVMRDVQISTVGCTSPAPIINPPTAPVIFSNSTYSVDICPGSVLNFSVTGISQSGSNNLFVYGNQSFLGGTCLPTNPPVVTASAPGGSSPNTATVTWAPQSCNSGPNVLILTFADSTCTTSQPIVVKSYMTILINVLDGVSGGGPYDYCPGGLPIQLGASGPAEITSWSWVPLPGSTQNPNLSNPNIANPTATPSGTVDVIVTGLPNSTGCPNKDTVTLTVHPALIISAGPDKFPCANDPVAITGSTNKPGGTVIWTPNTFVNGVTNNLLLNTTPLGSMGYELYYKDLNNCIAKDSMYVITIGTRPILGAYPAKNPVCVGESVQLFANASPQPCGKSANQCTGVSSKIKVGNGSVSNSALSPFYRDFSTSYRVQYLWLAEELKAAGLSPGNVKGLSLDLASSLINPATDVSNQLNIKMGCTNQSSLNTTTGFTNGLFQVFNSPLFVPTAPTTDIQFLPTNQFFWDGKTNLIVEFCYSLPQFSGGAPTPVLSSPTSFQSVLLDASNTGVGCNLFATAANSLIGSLRPNFKFDFCKTNTFNFNWTPAASFVNQTLENPNVKPGIIQGTGASFVVNVSSDTILCASTATVSVTTDQTGTVVATADNQHICAPGLVTLQANPLTTTPPVYTCGEENAIRNGATSNSTVGTGAGASNSSPLTYYPNSKYQYLLTKAMLNGAGITGNRYIDSIGINVLFKNSTVPYKDFSVLMGCTPLLAMPESYINLGSNKTVYNTVNQTINTGWNIFRFQNPFLWDGNSSVVVEMCYSNAAFGQSFTDDDIAVTSVATTLNYQQIQGPGVNGGCSFPSGNSFTSFARIGTEYPNTRIYSTPVSEKPFNYVWEPSLFVNDTTKQNTLAYVTQNTIYTVSLINKTGCKIKDTTLVEIVNHFINVTPADTLFCRGDAIKAYASGPDGVTSATYLWSPNVALNTTTGTEVIMNPATSTLYNVVRTDRFGCKDTGYVNAGVIPTPNVTITNGDTLTLLYNSLYNLNATGSQVYNWSPSWGFSNPNISSPTILPQEDGLYFVYGIDSNNCGSKDSVWINVTKVNPVVMPTVFSPNGDDVNDVFRIANMKFEKVQSFRVFNRWGEEVYSAIDNKGWDGSYKGGNLDMDSYYYNIILAYPDGTTKTLKGEVLLMK
jgi:gliding motility-associated-like protein